MKNNKEEICENCGRTEDEHLWFEGDLNTGENVDGCEKFRAKTSNLKVRETNPVKLLNGMPEDKPAEVVPEDTKYTAVKSSKSEGTFEKELYFLKSLFKDDTLQFFKESVLETKIKIVKRIEDLEGKE